MTLKSFCKKLGTVVAILAFVFGVLSFGSSTEVGAQCPTAPTQLVSEMITYRDCCGKLVTKQIERAPKVGEKAFVQCRCSEKKEASVINGSAVKAIFAILSRGSERLTRSSESDAGISHARAQDMISRALQPLVPPPNQT